MHVVHEPRMPLPFCYFNLHMTKIYLSQPLLHFLSFVYRNSSLFPILTSTFFFLSCPVPPLQLLFSFYLCTYLLVQFPQVQSFYLISFLSPTVSFTVPTYSRHSVNLLNELLLPHLIASTFPLFVLSKQNFKFSKQNW